MTDEGMVTNDVPSPTTSTITATKEEEESTVPDNDQKEETTMAAESILPPGKLYASERALQVDLADWAVWHGFGLVLQEPKSRKSKTAATSRSNNDDDNDGMCVMVCTNPSRVTNNNNNDATQSPRSCTFAIAYEKINGHHSQGLTMVRITPSSVYRHSCECRRVERNSSSSPAARTKIAKNSNEWIKLTQGKEFSRLLYTNPVCFLATHKPTNDTNPYNVMVLSWLTATNNNGDFMFSLNKNRHSATVPLGPEFTLSVPVQGMESLVCNVGGVSGKRGISKFAQDHRGLSASASAAASTTPTSPKTNKKHKGPKFPRGIPGLVRVPLGQGGNQATEHRPWSAEGQSQWPFAIQGTIAHLLCQVQYVMKNEREADWIDTDHCIFFAQVKQAFVHGSYWNESKKLFQPRQGNAPYLTFFGSQTFGYVAGQPLPTTSRGYH